MHIHMYAYRQELLLAVCMLLWLRNSTALGVASFIMLGVARCEWGMAMLLRVSCFILDPTGVSGTGVAQNGGFHKWGYPKMHVFLMEAPMKIDLGVFQETSK